jgi:DNA helicase-2/ATP-dependent DNA helicase PcrA
MSNSRSNKPDTAADIQLASILEEGHKKCFTMIAGAGSGKTTSLVKALARIINFHGGKLKLNRQRVACITYTEVAASEIWADVGSNPLIHVSTIHSFLWMVVRSFQSDIREWVRIRISDRISDLEAAEAAFGPRVQQRTREKNRRDIVRFKSSLVAVEDVLVFNYGTGPNYSKGILGHDDIIRMATDFLLERPLFRTLLKQQFPFVFVDEGQDTQSLVVEALKAVALQGEHPFCLGFFGDPMQKIFPMGIGSIALEEGWVSIQKDENFRCPSNVLDVANAIRRKGDDLVQVGGRTEEFMGNRRLVEGTACAFILPADERRSGFISKVREFMARRNGDDAWREGDVADVKLLVIVHRMAAVRLGFGELYSSMNDKAPSSFSDGFLDASAWPIKPFVTFVLPIVEAFEAGHEFEAITLLREYCPLLLKETMPKESISDLLRHLRVSTKKLYEMMIYGSGSKNRDVLLFLRDSQLITLDPRILNYLEEVPLVVEKEGGEEEEDGGDIAKEISSINAFLNCPAEQFLGFNSYIKQQSPFSTQQGIKGAEFDRVLVVLDDDEGTHVQFSYDKYFGVSELSPRDIENIKEGKENVLDRTRRLFYVCCTRALKDLVVIYFSTDPKLAEQKFRAAKIFKEDMVYNSTYLSDALG